MDYKLDIGRLVIAAYRSPYTFIKTRSGYRTVQNSGGLVSAILSLAEKLKSSDDLSDDRKIVWAGTSSPIPNDLQPQNVYLQRFDLAPIFLSPELNELFYGGFCNDLIWPLFHYFPSYCAFNREYFDAYTKANEIFCDRITELLKPGDFIWIHDYHLMMLPQMIRQKVPDVTIGFFLHIPFPSYEIFKLLPDNWQKSIINGLLGADLVGFHIPEYTKHFMRSVKEATGYSCNEQVISVQGRMVKAGSFPIGIDYEKFQTACSSRVVQMKKQRIKSFLRGKKLIFSVDRLDYTKGLLYRIKGFEMFLEQFPEWQGKVVFNMVVVPSRDQIAKYRKLKKAIEHQVGRINGKYSSLSWRPIIYQYKSLQFSEMIALYDLSDVGLITPLRDGMNLVAKEFIATQIENKGMLILSKMAGAAAELKEAILINPVDDAEMARAIKQALEMTSEEKQLRLEKMQKRIADYNVFRWAHDFIDQTCNKNVFSEKKF